MAGGRLMPLADDEFVPTSESWSRFFSNLPGEAVSLCFSQGAVPNLSERAAQLTMRVQRSTAVSCQNLRFLHAMQQGPRAIQVCRAIVARRDLDAKKNRMIQVYSIFPGERWACCACGLITRVAHLSMRIFVTNTHSKWRRGALESGYRRCCAAGAAG